MVDFISSQYEILQGLVKSVCQKSHRQASEVRLLVVSKGQSVEDVAQLYRLGQRDFGENYIDELLVKKKYLQAMCPQICWHFIGQIQTNKTKKIAAADYVHSVSSEKQALSLARYRTKENVLSVFLQVNLSKDSHRGGVFISDLESLCCRVRDIKELALKGLMVILPLEMEKKPSLGFRHIAEIKNRLEQEGYSLPELSMGMSRDFAEAIVYGATWIRIGSLLFGTRNK
jgi:PLP dependent protein